MARVTLIQVVYNSRKFIEPVFSAALNQTYKDVEFVAVIAGNSDRSKEFIQERFPAVKIIDPGYNIGFARGHNEIFARCDSEFFQLVNPDLIMTPTYVEEMLKAFADPSVGAATGKLLRYDFAANQPLDIIDTTGVTYAKSGRGRDRGQHEQDRGQYDNKTSVIAVSGAGAMYRKSALDQVGYFDEDFGSYWEDADLGLRLTLRGFKNVFVPKAVGYHGRGAGSSKSGYKNVPSFVKHHQTISNQVKRLNYRNHVFLFIKNSPKYYLQFFVREFFYNLYVLVFETRTLQVLPEFFRLLPKMKKKRQEIQKNRKISISEFEKLLT